MNVFSVLEDPCHMYHNVTAWQKLQDLKIMLKILENSHKYAENFIERKQATNKWKNIQPINCKSQVKYIKCSQCLSC